MQMTAMTSNLWFRKNWEQTPGLNEAELSQATAAGMKKAFKWLSPSQNEEEIMKDVYTFPNLISDELAAKVPPVVIVTGEFDMFRYAGREARDVYERNGKLAHYIEFGGSYHTLFLQYAMPHSDIWFNDFTRLCDYWL